ncbi:hypothetical protein K435DRAFT_967010 [Dendrothele bispora CBS 962.96]|uniref:Uncharacterized protein n=1 Tax=Dendrothele bispora (strain CBS 962.96) TaxID=1314807 RepID=A0A4S8LWX5_DENBC|nr:hypothetical protein K435DRAFT_967010 [Dendrothele bispora CBS 962.96]
MQDPTTDESILLCDRCRAVIPKYTGPACDDYLVKHRVSGTLDESDIHDILRTVETSDLEIQRYDTEIHQLRQILSKLKKERRVAVKSRNVQKALLSPIRRLPIEILGEIFSLCSHAPHEDVTKTYNVLHRRADRTLSMSVGVLNIASTCTLWRAISMSRPSLWSDITIHFDSLYDVISGHPLEQILECWLRYSKTSPLTLRLHTYGPLPGTGTVLPISDLHSRIERVLDLLLLESRRWESAVISMDTPSVLYMYGAKASFPKLQKLVLSFDQGDSGMTHDWPNYVDEFFASAPLRQLALPNCEFGLEDLFRPSAATSLTSLTFDTFYGETLHLLEHFPVVEHLRILRYRGPGFNHLNNSVIVRVERLSHLDIGIGIPDHRPQVFELDIFASLEAPRLLSLEISKHRTDFMGIPVALRWSSTVFRKMLDQSAFSLRSLSISRIEISNDQLLEVLDAMPKLTHLTVNICFENESYDPTALLRALIFTPASGLQLFHLEHLSVFRSQKINDDVLNLICDMLESRSRPLISESTSESTIQSTNQSLTKSTYSKDKNTFPCPLAYFKLVGSYTDEPETLTCMSRFQHLAGLPGRDYSFGNIWTDTWEAVEELSCSDDE